MFQNLLHLHCLYVVYSLLCFYLFPAAYSPGSLLAALKLHLICNLSFFFPGYFICVSFTDMVAFLSRSGSINHGSSFSHRTPGVHGDGHHSWWAEPLDSLPLPRRHWLLKHHQRVSFWPHTHLCECISVCRAHWDQSMKGSRLFPQQLALWTADYCLRRIIATEPCGSAL